MFRFVSDYLLLWRWLIHKTDVDHRYSSYSLDAKVDLEYAMLVCIPFYQFSGATLHARWTELND